MKPLRGARHGARPLTAPSTAPPRKLRLASQRSAENSIGTSEESSIGIDTRRFGGDQSVPGIAERCAREQLIAVDQVEQCMRLA
jgi:hypothetical protein